MCCNNIQRVKIALVKLSIKHQNIPSYDNLFYISLGCKPQRCLPIMPLHRDGDWARIRMLDICSDLTWLIELILSLSRNKLIQIVILYFSRIHFNTSFPSTVFSQVASCVEVSWLGSYKYLFSPMNAYFTFRFTAAKNQYEACFLLVYDTVYSGISNRLHGSRLS
jgi:hypothetical protein